LGVAIDRVLVGNGTAELLWLAGLAFLRRKDRVLVVGPTFGSTSGSRLLWGPAWKHGWLARSRSLPSSPGRSRSACKSWPRAWLLCAIPTTPRVPCCRLKTSPPGPRPYPGTLFVVDEAYLAFASDLRSTLTADMPNILILRSMTKDYALAGLRLGYALGQEAVIAALEAGAPGMERERPGPGAGGSCFAE